MVSLARPKKLTPIRGRCVALYSPSGAGVSMLINVVCSASNKETSFVELEEIYGGITLTASAEVFFTEFKTVEEATKLITNAQHLTFIKILTDGIAVDDATWRTRSNAIEQLARLHGTPIHTGINQINNPLPACIALANAAQLST